MSPSSSLPLLAKSNNNNNNNNLRLILVKTNRSTLTHGKQHTKSATQDSNDTTHRLSHRTAATTCTLQRSLSAIAEHLVYILNRETLY